MSADQVVGDPRRDARQPRYAVVMAGGQGTRFWPRSRRRLPKQLLAITGRHTLLQQTVARLVPLCSWRRLLVVTTSDQAAEVRRRLPRLPADQLLIEPMGRNTAACCGLAAEWIAAHASDALMVVAPADHVIKDARGLRRSLAAACALAAQQDCLVTLGIRPTRPEPGYGYIELGAVIDRHQPDARWVQCFHEKPSAQTAAEYVASGRYLWNSGIFVWKASVFRRALELCMPEMLSALEGLWTSKRGIQQRLRRAYETIAPVSVDVAVLQRVTAMAGAAPRVAVVPAGFDWNDVGSWLAMPDVWGRDRTGNAAVGRVLPIDVSGSIVYCPERLVALIGVKDVIVVDSADALLICARERAQDVRQVTHALAERGWSRYL